MYSLSHIKAIRSGLMIDTGTADLQYLDDIMALYMDNKERFDGTPIPGYMPLELAPDRQPEVFGCRRMINNFQSAAAFLAAHNSERRRSR